MYVGMEVNVVHYAKAAARLVLLQKALAPLPLNLYELPDRGDLVKLWEVAGALKRQLEEMCRAGCFIGWHRCKEVVDQDIATNLKGPDSTGGKATKCLRSALIDSAEAFY